MITKIQQKSYKKKQNYNKSSDTLKTPKKHLPLDKLAILDTNKAKWQKKARRKAISKSMAKRLLTVDKTTIRKSLVNTMFCTEQVLQLRHTAKVKRCKNRWCPICESVYAGVLMNGYKPSIDTMKEPCFLTLTIVAVKGHELKQAFKGMKDNYRNIARKLKTRCSRGGEPFEHNALRKLESNYNWKAETFNPHFHIVIDGWRNAEMIRDEWLKSDSRLSPKAQTLTIADPETVSKELFKYVTKTITKDKFVPEAQVLIFESLYKQNIYQAYGNVKRVKENITDHEPTPIDWKGDIVDLYQWNQQVYDWVNENGEPFTDYIPTPGEQTLINRLKLDKNDE